ncbi:MAG: hypothetical protein IPF51_15440 [Dehalococcoidia bacterium]|uniref:hypothetical protein n=1 Tax=Candidatus Amarobacter glycogenicus TaxID=3140699 RepID=UPI003135421D|nr:hypothetical protein [Dehalococcoidia bacterium]
MAAQPPSSLFVDPELKSPFSVSTSANGPAGGPTTILAGGTAYLPAGVSQIRRFSVNNYPTTVTSRAAMPFLDLQCATDGVNSDNADGAGWNGQSFPADSQNYCIAYVWDGTAPETPTPTATATTPATAGPTQTPTPLASPTATGTSGPAPSTDRERERVSGNDSRDPGGNGGHHDRGRREFGKGQGGCRDLG